MPQPAAALSITNMMNPHLFFLLHPYGSCSPATSSSASSTWRRSRCYRNGQERHAGEEEEGGQEEGRGGRPRRQGWPRGRGGGRGDSARDQCARDQCAARRGGSADEDRPSSRVLRKCRAVIPPSLPLPPSHPILPLRKLPNGKFRTPPNFSSLILFPSLAECRKHICAWAPRSQECGESESRGVASSWRLGG